MFSKAAAADLSKGSAATENSVVYEFKEPVVPAIFEALGSDMDDESVVRYIPSTKDIGAATPARIVAQISSEAFMDYELVSDFFLTFRSYLSTSNLLALLLARLEWAINRLEDDGRIIRIRTFAALRHWILNYFVDDFAADHDLRVRFCQTINAMYDHVKAREGGGMSDLKIIIDLKRCWQGKCSLFSRSLDLVSAYHNPHAAILPGDPPLGEDGADDNNRRAQNILQPNLPTSATAAEATNIGENTAGQHDRSDSAATAKTVPISSQSDQSFQASSCMLRPKSPKHASMPFAYNKGPRPVPLTPTDQPTGVKEPNPVSPIISKHHHLHGHTHKRSGSFSDSVRDERAPLSLLDQQNDPRAQDAMNIGALVRGELYPPSESCMTMMAPPSPPLLASDRPSSRDRQGPSDSNTKPGPANLGVKTIIGSIRRAFVPRNGGPTISSRTAGPSLAGKTSAVPNNIAVGSGFYRDRKMAALSKRPPRIDILCDKVLKQYQEAIGHSYAREHAQQAPDGFRSQGPLGELDAETATRSLAVPGQTGGKSQVTGGSESIVIVDDTGMEMPVMTGAEGEPLVTLEQAPSFLNIEDPTATPGTVSLHAPSQKSSLTVDDYSLPIYYDHASSPAQSRPTSSILDASVPRRTLSGSRGAASRMRTSLSHGLRKYASFQSGMSRYRASMGSEAAPTPAGLKASLLNHDRPTGPILRRRPGGDLRKMQGGGLEAHLTPGSFASDYSFRSSMPDRTATPPDNRRTRPETCLIPPNPQLLPMRNSAQNAGRSFEDAIARFAEIPDDDDGGIESTLLKLEGKWQDSSPESGSNTELEERQHVAYGDGGQKEQRYLHHLQHSPGEIRPISDRRHQHRVSEDFAYSQVRGRLVPPRPYSDSIAESEESYNSIPLLERGLSDDSMKKPQLSRVIPTPAPRSRLGGIPSVDTSDLESSHPSIDVVKKTDSVEGVPPGSTIPTPKASRNMPESFSGMSSDMSVDVIDRHEAMERQSMDTNSLGESMFGIPPHPLAHPPSPPMTIQNPRSMISCGTPSKPVLPPAPPLTPDPSPRNKALERGHIRSIDMQQISNDVLSRSEAERDGNHGNGPELDHVPFILSCESHVLAQQLTLVEMAALNEVDWRDLVEMRWSTSLPSTVSWVQFLFEEKRRGIDLVGGRFNLMVKWVLSEIVLTQDLHDRVRTITKFIHTAVHAKRLGNYATMSQITIALSSTNCSRLERTWGLVPQEEKNAFRSMESLIQPVRNFHDLRVEMETVNLQEGCIPFVGKFCRPPAARAHVSN